MVVCRLANGFCPIIEGLLCLFGRILIGSPSTFSTESSLSVSQRVVLSKTFTFQISYCQAICFQWCAHDVPNPPHLEFAIGKAWRVAHQAILLLLNSSGSFALEIVLTTNVATGQHSQSSSTC